MASLDTKKILTHIIEGSGTVVVTITNVSILPLTIKGDAIKSEHVCINYVLSNPSAQTADWAIITNDGQITIDVDSTSPTDEERTNAISGTTDITMYLNLTSSLHKSDNDFIVVPFTVSTLPKRLYCSGSQGVMTPNHVVVHSVLSNPSAQTADWKVTTGDGVFIVDSDSPNALNGTTDVTLYFSIQTA